MASVEVYRTAETSIQNTQDLAGGHPCIRDTRITVHGLVEYRKLGLSDAEILARIHGLTSADLQAAWKYYEQHPAEIDLILREDAEA
jgi:uncharacterized protein (DUF433 family)